MIPVVLVCAGLVVGQTADKAQLPSELKTYEALKAKAGRKPEAQVKLALWCEAHGLSAERLKHLAMAVLFDPRNTAARGLLGLIDSNGRWETPERARERIKADAARSAKLAEYERRRAKLTADEISSQQAQDRLEQRRRLPGRQLGPAEDNRRLAQRTSIWASGASAIGLDARGDRPLHGSRPLRPLSGFELETPGICQAGRTMDESATRPRCEDREEREQKQAARYWEPLLKKWKSWLGDKRQSRGSREPCWRQ